MTSKTRDAPVTTKLPSIDAGDTLPVAQSIAQSLQRSRHHKIPYDYWLLENVFPEGLCEMLADLPFHAPGSEEANFDGRRNTNNKLRIYFNSENQVKFPAIQQITAGFDHPLVRRSIEELSGANLDDTLLRIEYCQDMPGFWLEPHTDISVKKLSMLVFLLDDPVLAGTGTDIFTGPPEHAYVTSAPYGCNKGILFVPAANTWHGAGHNPVPPGKVRKSLIINFVSAEWREKRELA